jgi:molecular chaperone GrpE
MNTSEEHLEEAANEQVEDKKDTNQAEEEQSENLNEDASSDETTEVDPVKEANDKFLRLYSEFENFRRRTAREKMELITSANAQLLEALLPVVDDFDRAMKSMNDAKSLDAVKEGMSLVHHKFIQTLEQKGLKAFDSKEKAFDPDFHEAVTKIPAPKKKLKGKVVDEIEKGYMLGEKVLRYAKVVVGE